MPSAFYIWPSIMNHVSTFPVKTLAYSLAKATEGPWQTRDLSSGFYTTLAFFSISSIGTAAFSPNSVPATYSPHSLTALFCQPTKQPCPKLT